MFKNIIWDFDGTLFNTYPGMTNAFKRALYDYGIDVSQDEILKYMKVSVSNAVNHFKEIYPLDSRFAEKFAEYEKEIKADEAVPFPFAKEICIKFKKVGGRNFILTHRGDSIFKYLEYHGMLECFEEIATKDKGFKRKPDPEGFSYFVKKYSMKKGESLGIGDRECDILGAKGAGIKTCLYNTNNAETNEKIDFEIKSLSELNDILF